MSDYEEAVPLWRNEIEDEEAVQLWRNEIEEAKPLDELLGIGTDINISSIGVASAQNGSGYIPASRHSDTNLDRVDIVRDADLTQYPYQSVGKLIILVDVETKDGTVPSWKWVTAFYIGNKQLITAAHAFVLPSSSRYIGNATFIPAMIDKRDVYGDMYGNFKITGHRPHRLYEEDRKPQHDICIVEVGEGSRYKTIDQANLKPINVDKEPHYDASSAWKVLGYGTLGKMYEIRATYSTIDHDQVHMDLEVLPGMSGGPWLCNKSFMAQGITAGNSLHHPGCAVSPHFSAELFDYK